MYRESVTAPPPTPLYATLATAAVAAAALTAAMAVAWLRERRRRVELERRLIAPGTASPRGGWSRAHLPGGGMDGPRSVTDAPAVPSRDDAGRQEEILRRSERLASLGRMLAGTAHELNNPLAAVCGFAQLLLRGDVSDEQRQALETIDREATRAAAVVRDLLTFARHHEQEATPQPVELNAVVRYVIGTRRYSLRAGGISLELDLCPGTLRVLGVTTQLEQVVLNLVSNAEQALESSVEARASAAGAGMTLAVGAAGPHPVPPGGPVAPPRLVVRTRRSGDQAVVQVTDNGPGIPEDRLSLIWDPFWTTRADSEGTGLGLPVVHGIVSSHGGTVEVNSRPGEATSFVVSLPLHERGDEEEGEGEREGRHGGGSGPSPLDVLVLGLDADASFLTRLLGARGHAVVGAPDAEQAMRLTAGGGFDVLLVECALVDTVTELWLRDLGERPPRGGRRTRILLVTEPSTITPAAERVRADAILSRPFDVDALRRAVERG